MTAISATLQKPTPQPDREVVPSQSEADGANPSTTGAMGGFADALRAASGQPARSPADTDATKAAEPDDGTAAKSEAAQAPPAIPAVPPAADLTNAAAILANILNSVASAGSPPVTRSTGAGGTVGSEAADGAPGLRANASASASTGGSPTQGGTSLGIADTVRAAASMANGTIPATTALPNTPLADKPLADTPLADTPLADTPSASTPSANLPKVSVLESAAHFAPVLPKAAAHEPAVPALAPSAAGPAGATAAKAPPVQAGLQDLIGAEPHAGRGGLAQSAAAATLNPPAPGPSASQPRPASDLASASARAAGSGLETVDVAALSDTRAVTGIARSGLGVAGQSEGAEIPTPEGPTGAGPALPANALPTIAAAIRDELARAAAPEAAARTPQADPTLQPPTDGPLRVLKIQLRPDDLGTVTVELRLMNGQLETHLRASKPETAALLHRDAAILTDLLKQANYQAEVTVGQARSSDMGGSSGGSASQGQPGFSDGGARPGPGGDRQRQAERNPAAGRREGERGDETTRPRDGGVYL